MYFLVKQGDEALLDSQKMFDDKDHFGPLRCIVLSECNKELDEVFGDTHTE